MADRATPSKTAKPNFKNDIKLSLDGNHFGPLADWDRQEVSLVDAHIVDAVKLLAPPQHNKRLLLALNDEAQYLVSDAPLAAFADQMSAEWTAFEERKRQAT